ncbi:hypothetical protein WR25_15782 [Diploscapter pachys]|uniref:Uncharacterized protein n=1 Tax=Diploscapter pachys TaxID=2018661 RepID=A0A2A2JXH1_9BILA|nr:hypothetical protein WR25_15782 [Diploscapter pachys]
MTRGWWVKPQVPVAVFPARSRTMPPRAPPFHSMKLGFTSPSIMNADAVKVMPSTTLVLPYAASLRRFLSVIGWWVIRRPPVRCAAIAPSDRGWHPTSPSPPLHRSDRSGLVRGSSALRASDRRSIVTHLVGRDLDQVFSRALIEELIQRFRTIEFKAVRHTIFGDRLVELNRRNFHDKGERGVTVSVEKIRVIIVGAVAALALTFLRQRLEQLPVAPSCCGASHTFPIRQVFLVSGCLRLVNQVQENRVKPESLALTSQFAGSRDPVSEIGIAGHVGEIIAPREKPFLGSGLRVVAVGAGGGEVRGIVGATQG